MSENKEKNKNTDDKMEKIVSLCKRRGFVFPGSEIYGGLAGTYDYGPLGALLKKNIEEHTLIFLHYHHFKILMRLIIF